MCAEEQTNRGSQCCFGAIWHLQSAQCKAAVAVMVVVSANVIREAWLRSFRHPHDEECLLVIRDTHAIIVSRDRRGVLDLNLNPVRVIWSKAASAHVRV